MCCGKNRSAARAAAIASVGAGSVRPAQSSHPGAARPQGTVVIFEYIGNGTASIRGEVSGQIYRFARPGDRLRVDPRDRGGLMRSPQLRWIR